VASDYLLNIDGIQGDSTVNGHEGEIVVDSFSWGASNPGTGRGTGAGVGKVSVQDIHFSSTLSKASPSLFKACASGIHFKKAQLTVRKAGEKPLEYLKVVLTDVIVTSYQTGGTDPSEGDSTPVDQFSLNFGQIQFNYFSQNPTGGLDPGAVAAWDVTRNQAL